MDVRILLEHEHWIRALARSLLADHHLADDVTQQAMLVAIQSAPVHHAATRTWLRKLVRNLSLNLRRSECRRRRREQKVAAKEAHPEAHVAVAELRELLVEAVASLRSPYSENPRYENRLCLLGVEPIMAPCHGCVGSGDRLRAPGLSHPTCRRDPSDHRRCGRREDPR